MPGHDNLRKPLGEYEYMYVAAKTILYRRYVGLQVKLENVLPEI